MKCFVFFITGLVQCVSVTVDKHCIFPFEYNGVTYRECTNVTAPTDRAGQLWCPTLYNKVTLQISSWAFCAKPIKSCRDEVGGVKWIKNPSDSKYCYRFDNSTITGAHRKHYRYAQTWNHGREICQAFGGDLLSITSESEYRWIKELIHTGISDPIWTGLNDLEYEGIWKWSDGSVLRIAKWLEGQPNSYGGMEEDCIALVPTTGEWGDTSCIGKFNAICKIIDPAYIAPNNTETTITEEIRCYSTSTNNISMNCECSEGYELVDDACFKITNEYGTRQESSGICGNYGGHLAYFDESYGNVRNWLRKKAITHEGDGRMWFGLIENNVVDMQSFGYNVSDTFRPANYTDWNWNQPQRARKQHVLDPRGVELEGVHCVVLNIHTGKWSVANCLSVWPALCIKKPELVESSTENVNNNKDNIIRNKCGSDRSWRIWNDVTSPLSTTYCYRLTEVLGTYQDARTTCQPGYVATIHSIYEQVFISNEVFKNDKTGAWIGVKRNNITQNDDYEGDADIYHSERHYGTGDATSIIFSHFSTDPIRSFLEEESELCTYMSNDGFWNYGKCINELHKSICKKLATGEKETEHRIMGYHLPEPDFGPEDEPIKLVCPAKWTPIETMINGVTSLEKCAYIVQNEKQERKKSNWGDARLQCSEMSTGNNAVQLLTVTPNYRGRNISWFPSGSFWSGLHKVGDIWRLDDGTEDYIGPMRYHVHWDHGLRCAAFHVFRHLVIPRATSCLTLYSFICETNPMTEFEAEEFTRKTPSLSVISNKTVLEPCNESKRSDLKYYKYGGKSSFESCYYFSDSDDILSYHEAEDVCRKMGANLLTIENAEENTHIYAMRNVLEIPKMAYIGLNSLDSKENTMRWSSGAPLSFENWNAGEPNSLNNTEKCANIAGKTGQWGDLNCGRRLPYICELKTQSNPKLIDDYRPKGWCPAGTIHFQENCYSIFAQPADMMTFNEAREYCEGQVGRQLASFQAYEELNYILSHVCDDDTIHPTINSLWIGFFKLNSFRIWLDNSKVMFTNWGSRQAFEEGICTFMSVNTWDSGRWYKSTCQQRRGFICLHKRWETPKVVERCQDKPPQNDVNMCRRARASDRCRSLPARQIVKCMLSCRLCHHQSKMNPNLVDTITSECPALLVGGTKIERKRQGKNCITTKINEDKGEHGWRHRKTFTYDEAVDFCAHVSDKTRGMGQLISVDTDCKEKFLLSMLKASGEDVDNTTVSDDSSDVNSDGRGWIGLTFDSSTNRFVWANGAKFEHDMWDANEPVYEKLNTTKCVSASLRTGKWKLTDCNERLTAYCINEAEKPKSLEDNERVGICPSIKDSPYKLYHRKDRCYMLVEENNFYDGSAICATMGAQLLYLNGREEQNATLEHFNNQTDIKNSYWLGLYRVTENIRGWYPNFDETVQYINFHPDPHSRYPARKCSKMLRNSGYWKDEECSRINNIICVKSSIMRSINKGPNETQPQELSNVHNHKLRIFEFLFGAMIIICVALAVYYNRGRIIDRCPMLDEHMSLVFNRQRSENFQTSEFRRGSNSDESKLIQLGET